MAKRKLHSKIMLSPVQCRSTKGEKDAHGKPIICGDVWRVVKVNEKETVRYGTMHCLNHHETTGKYATLFQKVRKGAKPKRIQKAA